MYDDIIQNCARIYKIDEKLIRAIIQTESSWNPWAIRVEKGFWKRYLDGIKRIFFITPKGDDNWLNYPDYVSCSYGLMQIMLTTAMEHGFRFTFPTELLDPGANIKFGCAYLKRLFERYGDWNCAIAAYNAGSARKNMDGTFENQEYLDKVLGNLKKLGEG